jgi:hypothetical protein
MGLATESCAKHLDQVLHPVFIGMYGHSPGINVAKCAKNGEHLTPAPHGPCTCGFYASHRGLPLEYLNQPIFAVIKATGRILLSDIGFRAERIEIEALSVGSRLFWEFNDFTRLRIIGRHFDVPVFVNPEEMLAAHPPQDLAGLIPAPEVDYSAWFPCQTMYTDLGTYQLLQGPGWSFAVIGPDGKAIPIPAFRRKLTLSDGRVRYVIERNDKWLLGTTEPHIDRSIRDLQITAE